MPRRANELRPVKIKRRFTRPAPGSVLYQCGRTIVLCTASVQQDVPPWMAGQGKGANGSITRESVIGVHNPTRGWQGRAGRGQARRGVAGLGEAREPTAQ